MQTTYPTHVSPLPAPEAAPPNRARLVLLVAAFACVVALISYRAAGRLNIPNRPDAMHWVLQDFRDAVYYPAVAFLDGHNPYETEAYMGRYPVWFPLPLYSPHTLLIHLPFALLPFQVSESLYYFISILLTVVLAAVSFRYSGLSAPATSVWALAGVILLSRPGQMNVLLGQVTLQVTLGAYVALRYARTRPWVAGFGLALALIKPSFGAPLALLMLSRRDTRAVLCGLAVAALAAVATTGVLVRAAGGITTFVASVVNSHHGFAVQAFNQSGSGPFRIDTAALLARVGNVELSGMRELAVGIGILLAGALMVRRLSESDSAEPLSTAVICLTVLMCTYHQAYDLLLLTWPVTALIAAHRKQVASAAPFVERALLVLLMLPAVNYVASATAIEVFDIEGPWWTVVTSINPAALLIAWLLIGFLVLRSSQVRHAARANAQPRFVPDAWIAPCSVTLFVLVVCMLSYRASTLLNVQGSVDSRFWVLQDFRDAIYYPVVAFLHGHNPYDVTTFPRLYPVGQVFPPYSPLTMIIHLPFGLLPPRAAELTYFVITIALSVAVAWMVLAMCEIKTTVAAALGLAALLLLSRPGHWNLLLGQCTLQLIIATYLALHYARERPWLAAIGLAITTAKPTFGVAVTVLMLAQRRTRPVVIGLTIAAVLSAAATAVLAHAAGGLVPFLSSLRHGYAGFTTAWFVNPAESPVRVDAVAFIGRLIGRAPGPVSEAIISMTILAIGALAVRRLSTTAMDQDTQRLVTSLSCAVVLTYTYQQSYNTLLLALPLTALATDRWAPEPLRRPLLRWLLLALFSVPMLNYLASFSVLESLDLHGTLWIVVTSMNGAALLAALLIYLGLALAPHPNFPSTP